MLYPISVTQPDWDYLKKALADGMHMNVDSGIIHNRMQKDLGTFVGVLGLSNDPMTDLRSASMRTLRHVSVGFAMLVDFKIMKFMSDSTIHTTIEQQGNEYFIVATGTLKDWLVAAEEACKEDQYLDLRIMFNKIIVYFDNINLKQAVNAYTKVKLQDNTFSLKRN